MRDVRGFVFTPPGTVTQNGQISNDDKSLFGKIYGLN